MPRPVLGSETPYRRKKAEQEGPEAGAFSVRPASLLEFLVRVKAQQGEMAGEEVLAIGWDIVKLQLEPLC